MIRQRKEENEKFLKMAEEAVYAYDRTDEPSFSSRNQSFSGLVGEKGKKRKRNIDNPIAELYLRALRNGTTIDEEQEEMMK